MAFIRNKLIEEAVVVLGQLELPETLAQCYCLTNPRLFDDPIVLVSEGFERLTGCECDCVLRPALARSIWRLIAENAQTRLPSLSDAIAGCSQAQPQAVFPRDAFARR